MNNTTPLSMNGSSEGRLSSRPTSAPGKAPFRGSGISLTLAVGLLLVLALTTRLAAALIHPGQPWLDTDGQPIQAHSASILFHNGVYYWYGENKSAPNDPPDGRNLDRVPVIGVSAYSSRDLVHWKNEGLVLKAVPDDPAHDLHPSKVCERPKVLFNARTKQFVMWWHMDTADYLAARAGVAVADQSAGPFRYLRSFRPINDQRFRDMNLFLDDDGQAYVFYASEDNATLYVSRLNPDFTDVERPAVEGQTWRRNFPGASREAPAPFKHAGRYYLITSGCTGWNPNAADLAIADHPLGPYVSQGNPCSGPNADKTFGAQSTFVLPVSGQPGSFIFLADRWNPKNLRDSRYVWLPFDIVPEQPVRIDWRDAWDPQAPRTGASNPASTDRVSHPSSNAIPSQSGHDWSLPNSVRETPNAGWAWCTPEFACDWQKRFPIDTPADTVHFCGYKYLIWADVNPAPNQYNWAALDKWIAELAAVPHMGFAFFPAVFSRMLDGDRGVHTGKQYMAPHWIETEGWQGRKVRFYKDGEPTGWEPDSGYLGALEAFLGALAERYAKHPRFAYVDIRCIDHIYGEGQLQGASTKAKMDDLEKNYGYSPERYEAYMRALLDLYARLFPGQEAKCVIQTMGPYMAGPPGRYDAASERAWLYGFSKGFGGRDGMVESWMQYLNLGNGCSLDPVTLHLLAEEEWHPVLKAWDKDGQGPVWLTENEEWGADSDRGPKENEVTGWFVSNLRALQMRRSWIGLSSRTVWRDVPMSRYFQLSLGKNRASSPDAWCWLRESGAFGQWFQYPEEKKLLGTDRIGPTNGWLAQHYGYPREYEYINSGGGAVKVKNFERWLMQFDTAPDGMTQPALRTDTFQKAWDRKDRSPDKLWGQSHGGATGNAEHWARRTDHATGQNAIYFRADPKWFQAYTGAARLFVTYQDTNASSWRLEYQDRSGARLQSPVVTTENSGEIRTVTLELPSLAAKGGFAGTNDFRIVRLSGGDVVVQLVRLLKWDSAAPKSASIAQPTALHQPAEDDWWLPDWVKPVPNSGIYAAHNAPPGFVDVEHVTLPWKSIEPAEGVYDWSLLTNALARGHPVWLRFFASDVTHCPAWLQRKYPDLKHHRFRWPDGGYDDITGYIQGQTTIRSAGDFYEIWDSRFEAEFRRLLQEFSRQGFGRDPRIRFVYFPHAFRWNEYSLKWVPEMSKAGFTPEDYVAWFKRTLADYVAAFGDDAGRIVYTGTGNREWIEWTGDEASFNRWDRAINTSNGGNVLSQSCLNSGVGVRDGFTEAFNRFSWRPDWGLDLVTEGSYRYSVINEKHPLISADRRFFGTENEDFDYLWPDVKHYHFLKLSTLNMLRLRMNWVFLGDYRVAPELLQYMRRTMGRKVQESPDAWVALRQYRDPYLVDDQRGDGTENIRNFERWLYQRDMAPDGLTMPTHRIEPPPKFAALNGGSWEALRTDQARGSHRLYFNVDDPFLKGGPTRVLIKVTHLDDREGEWWIEYDAGADAVWKKSPPVQHARDGRWKTATVELPDAAFENRQRGWADFCITKGGTQDLAVRFVRVIKTAPPNPSPAK